jgi:hypothetical protein
MAAVGVVAAGVVAALPQGQLSPWQRCWHAAAAW